MRLQRAAVIAAIAWTVLVAWFFLFGTVGGTLTASHGVVQRGKLMPTASYSTGFKSQQPTGLVAIAFPMVLAAAPLFARRERRTVLFVTGILLLVLSVLTASSGGLFYVPAALLLLLGTIRASNAPRAT
jgi:hypothetical protein